MAKVGTFAVDGDATPDAVTALIPCRFVDVRENGLVGSTDFDVYDPDTNATPIRYVAGETYRFDAGAGNLFQAGQTVGLLKAVTGGSYTFSKKCF
jgi:hypothetical protein